jgi:ribosomal protein S12 methylthiotransferase accessory factor YcaO
MPEQKPEAKVVVSDELRAVCENHVRRVHEEFAGKWSQTKCSIALNRAIREILQGKLLKPAKDDAKTHAQLLQAGVFFSNSSAVRQSVLEKKTSTPTASKVEEYANLA